MRRFNVTGTCVPEEDYMVNITEKLVQIKAMVDRREYFTINRGRQYGKTTTLSRLRHFLADKYTVIFLSFEGFDDEEFANAEVFCQTLLESISQALSFTSVSEDYRNAWLNEKVKTFSALSRHMTKMCEGKKLVLVIDEVDKVSNNRVFLGFLSKLREKFLARRDGRDFTFHSVILAGVYDIRNIKLKLIQEGLHTPSANETTTYNSPWNIAADFDVVMSFSPVEIETMLNEYEKDYEMGVNIAEIAKEIYSYTGGYPVLVSRICKYIDEKLEKDWRLYGIRKAVNLVLKENSPLFESLVKNLASNQELSDMTYDVLMRGGQWTFTYANPMVGLGARYGYFKDVHGRVKISNKIFEMMIVEYFVSQDQLKRLSPTVGMDFQSDIVDSDGKFNMQVCLEKFAKYYHEHYSEKDIDFLHDEARYFLLFFLNPLLNGRGFVHPESEFTDGRRMDLVVSYLDQQFIIELKIWRGEKRHDEGYTQLLGYIDKKNLKEGYLLTFDFRENKQVQQNWVEIADGKRIFDIRI